MKRKYPVKTILFVLILLSVTSAFAAPEYSKEEVLTDLTVYILKNWHYSGRKIDDEFSQRVFNLYLNQLDYNKWFLTAGDILKLKQYEFKIDDELKRGTLVFYRLGAELLRKRISEIQGYIQEIMQEPCDFTLDEVIETDPEKRVYVQDQTELRERWRKILKYQTAQVYLSGLEVAGTKEEKEKGKNEASAEKNRQAEALKKAEEQVEGNLRRTLSRLHKEEDNVWFSRFLNAVAGSFDPHTTYFPPAEKENFEIDMTGTLEGIGALLQEEGEYIKVVEIVPGSPSWKQNELKAGDIILKVAQGDGEPVDIVNMPVNEAVKLIRGKAGTEVRLTVKKPDGRMMVIPIIRGIVVLEEAYARSAVIHEKTRNEKFGYISLPSFYHDTRTANGRNAADDLRRELLRLKGENVRGVIIDLRNNGGGFLDDAIKMAGLFIKEGPILQVTDGSGRKMILRDPDPGIYYEDPVIVLVNYQSASAAEILAAALQDYGRAVIVGSEHTFGKGTVQEVFDLDHLINIDYLKPLGSLKYTKQKYYRITGKSTQYQGVTPDIILPDPYGALEIGERSLNYPLPWDVTSGLKYNKWNGANYNLDQLKERSLARVQTSEYFALVRKNLERAKKQRKETMRPLQLEKLLAEQEAFKEAIKENELLAQEQPNIEATVPQGTAEAEDYKIEPEKLNKWLGEIRKDIYIAEAVNILQEMVD